ncbi:YbjN domain-containing protein [Actinomycetaceae bacterium TAE3-ERU4]|nr:YbjN domain-containing protein [Actinomycetaceae bacterium TAE3-ERU4]
MSWFKKNGADNLVPPALTLERVAQTLKEEGYNFDVDESKIIAIFDGFFTVMDIRDQQGCLIINSRSSKLTLPLDRYVEARTWANTWNENTLFGTAYPIKVDDEVEVMSDVVVFADEGITEEQLKMSIGVGLQCNVQALTEFAEHFGLSTPDNSVSSEDAK